MAIEVDPRVFAGEDELGHDAREGVCISSSDDPDAAARALSRAADRWWLVDGRGREHVRGSPDYEAWQDALANGEGGVGSHCLKWVSDITLDPRGPALSIDAQSLIPAEMRDAYVRILVEEIEREGLVDVLVLPDDEDDED
jgi:hypothetical protein